MIQDFLSSGLIDAAAERHRVIAFDRPGYGYSDRPRGRLWTADAQADLFAAALRQLGARDAVVLGHSWGCSVAVSLARRNRDVVAGLVLEGGYFYPSARLDVWFMSLPAVPLLGDVLRHTVSPPLSRALWPLLMRKIFGPNAQPPKFKGFPRGMALRPSQLRASAEESALMIPGAIAAQGSYADLTQPVAIIAGANDRMVSAEQQSARLHKAVPQSDFMRVPETGHMVHHTATDAVLEAVNRVAVVARGS
jgi:pimeloyl-ACP methyl ester carboxylesterase